MIRSEIFTAFRAECPEITERVVGDSLLAVWAKLGDKLVCALTRCIVSDFTFNSVATSSVYSTRYDLTTEESKFYDIDENPGGGVSFNDVPLDKRPYPNLTRRIIHGEKEARELLRNGIAGGNTCILIIQWLQQLLKYGFMLY